MNSTSDQDFEKECKCMVVEACLAAAENKPIPDRIMLLTGITHLFPKTSAQFVHLASTISALKEAERRQLTLTQLLKES